MKPNIILRRLGTRVRRNGPRGGIVAALLLLCAAPRAEIVRMVTLIDGAQVPLPNITALGAGWVVVDTDANTLTYEFRHRGLSAAETVAHIHGPAEPGTDAGPMHTLPPGEIKAGVWNYAENQEADILGGRTYINIHSGNFPSGEIRGQIVSMVAMLTPQQEGGTIVSSGSGTGLFMVDTDANTLDYHIVYGGLSSAETAAHIHGYSLHGASSSPVHTLPATAGTKTGTWNYNEADEAAILNGRTYVNIHTGNNAGGEIRGQITNMLAFLDPAQEGGAIVSPAYGLAFFSLSPAALTLGYYITYSGLTSAETMAHIHGYATAGTNASPLHTLPTTNPKLGTWNYGTAALGALNQTYVNVHTVNNGGGEIRGQLNVEDTILVPVGLSRMTVE